MTSGDTGGSTSGDTDTTGSEPTTGAAALDPKLLFRSTRDGTGRLYWMNTDGSEQVAITPELTDENYLWTPDGASVLYVRESRVWLLDPETGSETNLTPNHYARQLSAVAPSGQWFLFRGAPEGDHELYRASIDGSEVLRLTTIPSEYTVNSASISPDETKIAFAWFVQGDHYMDVMKADGMDRVELLEKLGLFKIEKVIWSPDSSEFLIGARYDGANVYTVRPDGSALKQLTMNGGVDPSWTSDGSRIVLAADMGISVMNRDGTGLTPIAPTQIGCFNPELSSDETQIVYNCVRDDEYHTREIYTVPLAGGTPVQLTDNIHNDDRPKWRPNSGE